MFEVDNFIEFVAIQTETAVRHIANTFPYDLHGEDATSLRDNADEIIRRLSAEIAARGEAAGVLVIESRITHLAYAPRSRRRCCAGSRRARWSRPAHGSSSATDGRAVH